MGITLTTAARNAACNALADLADVGSTDANADLVVMTSGDVEVSTHAMSNPAFGDASNGVATADAIADDTSATGGTAALHKIQDRDNTEIWRGTVGAGSGDLSLSSVTIGAGDTVSISGYTLTVPAS